MSNFGKLLQVFILALAPWYCYFLGLYAFVTTRQEAIMIAGSMWMLVSPGLMLIVAVVAYREGQWSVQNNSEKG